MDFVQHNVLKQYFSYSNAYIFRILHKTALKTKLGKHS